MDEVRTIPKAKLYNDLAIPPTGALPLMREWECNAPDVYNVPEDVKTRPELKAWAEKTLPAEQRVTPPDRISKSSDPSLDEYNLARDLPQSHSPVRVLGHQLHGVSALVLQAYQSQRRETPSATLFCDEMGLGKTFTVILYVALVSHYAELQAASEPQPLLLSGRSLSLNVLRFDC